MRDQFTEGLKELKNSLDRIRSLCEWRQLGKAQRRKGEPPSFQLYDPIEGDIQLEVGVFHSRAFDIKDYLPKLPPEEREKVIQKLNTLETRLQAIL